MNIAGLPLEEFAAIGAGSLLMVGGAVWLGRMIWRNAHRLDKDALPIKQYATILLPIGDGLPPETGQAESSWELLSAIAASGATVHLSYLLEVPRALSLSDAPSDLVESAQLALQEGATLGERFRLRVVPSIRRCRIAREEIFKAILETKCEIAVVISAGEDRLLLAELAERATCELLIDRPAQSVIKKSGPSS